MRNWSNKRKRAVGSFAALSLVAAMMAGAGVSGFSSRSYAVDAQGQVVDAGDLGVEPIGEGEASLEGTNLAFDVGEAFQYDTDGDGAVTLDDLPDKDEYLETMREHYHKANRLEYAQEQWDKGKRPALAGPHKVRLPEVPNGEVVFDGEDSALREKEFEGAGEKIRVRFIPDEGYALSYVNVFTELNHVDMAEDDLGLVKDGVLTIDTVDASIRVNALFTYADEAEPGEVRAVSTREGTTFGLEVEGEDVPIEEADGIPEGADVKFYFGFTQEAHDDFGHAMSPFAPADGDAQYLTWDQDGDPKYWREGSAEDGTVRDGDFITYAYEFKMPGDGVDFTVLADEQWEYGEMFPGVEAQDSREDRYFANNGTLAVGNTYSSSGSLADDPGAGSDGYEWFGVRNVNLAGGGMSNIDRGIRFTSDTATYYPGYSGNGSRDPGTWSIATLESGQKIACYGEGGLRTYEGLAHCLSPGKPTPNGNGSLTYTCLAMTDEGYDDDGVRWGWAYFWCYVHPDTGEQDGGFYIKVRWMTPPVCIRIEKTDANPSITAASDCYSLGGAEFGVFSDSRCRNLLASCHTDSYGRTDIAVPSLGSGDRAYTYYIKELSPSPGYLVNGNVYSISLPVGGKNSRLLEIPEEPVYHDPDIRIYKRDATTGRPVATGAGTLGGAEFTIRYYDNVDGFTYGTPDRTWVIRTDENGSWQMNTMYNTHKVSGDPWFMANGVPILVAGTYTFQETKPPVGYLASTDIIKEIVKADDYDNTSIAVFNDPEVPETPIRGGFKMQKHEVGNGSTGSGDITMAGAVYEVVNNTGKSVVVEGKEATNGAVCYTFTTNATGGFTSANNLLPYGSYTVREKTPPAGMLLTGDKLSASFTVTTNGQMADLTAGQLADPPVRGDVQIAKEDPRLPGKGPEGDANLSGITFTVYNRSARAIKKPDGTSVAPGGVVTTVTTSMVNGKAVASTSGGMLSYGTYGIKETATNNTYQLTDGAEKRFRVTAHNQVVSVDASNNALVANNVPVLGGFEFQKIDKETGTAVPQGDATLGGGLYEIVNKSENAVSVAGKVANPGEVCFSFTTDANGHYKSAADLLPYGSYTIREKTAPLGMSLKGKLEEDFQVRSQGAFTDLTKGAIANELVRGDLELEKQDIETGDGSSQGDAELDGITFVVKNASGKAVLLPDGTAVAPGGEMARITTSYIEGKAIAKTEGRFLPYGTYTVQEVATNESYLLTDGQPKTFQVRTDSEIVKASVDGDEIVFKNQVIRGGVRGKKLSHVPGGDGYDGPLGDATLANGRLAVRNLSKHPVVVNGQSYGPGEECLYIMTNEDGTWSSAEDALPYGLYEIREKDAPVGYRLNTDWHPQFRIHEDGEMQVLEDENALEDDTSNGGVNFGKNDIEFGLSEALGGRDFGANSEGSHLDGIVFRIKNASKNPVLNADQELVMPGEVVCDIVTEWHEELGRYAAVTTDVYLQYGTYTVEEYEQDRDGSYQIVDKEPRTFQIREASHDIIEVDGMECTTYSSGRMTTEDVDGQELVFENQVTRGDFSFTKVAGGQAKRLSVPFKLTNVATGETHLIVTDKNGMFSSEASWTKHSKDTNGNDGFLGHGESADDPITMADLNMRAGVWFGKGEAGSMSDPKDDLGALPYGEYLLEELHSDTNEGYEMQTFTFYVYNHGATVDGGTLVDERGKKPEIHTAAADPATGLQEVLAEESTTIVDNVTYNDLNSGEDYEIRGILMDKETGRALTIDGKRVEATKEFRAAGTSGTVKVEYTFNALSLKGKTVVIFEDLYKDGKKVVSHSDIDDPDQTITFPEIRTHATDGDGEQDTGAYEEVTIRDTVTYENLIPGRKYVMKGQLMIKEKRPDGSIKERPLIDANGNTVEEEVEFTPDSPDGTVEVVFTFDGSTLAGKTVVAFEELQQSGVTIGVHMDITDKEQTVNFPKVSTQAREQESGGDEALAGKDVSIVDKVSYEGLIPGREYTMSGTLMDKATDQPVESDGEPVAASTKFTASESGSGYVELTFTFDGSVLEGHTTVVFEDLYRNGRKLATHADIQDEGQTITFPGVQTTATDTATGSHGTEADVNDKVTDRVIYSNLVPGREYTLTGTLMVQSTGEPLLVDGKPVEKTVKFTPENPSGYIDLVFEVDTSALAGETLVAFEELKRDGFTVGIHMDINDEKQSVKVHQIRTEAWDEATKTQAIAKGGSIKVIDRVRYIGLEAGKEYALRCIVMDTETGKALRDSNRDLVTGTLEFTAEDTSGAVKEDLSSWGYADVELTLDSIGLAGKSLTMFEYLVEPSDDYGEGVPEGVKIAKHTDLTDEGQTVHVPEVGTEARAMDGGDLLAAVSDAGIIDTVSYKNLVPGQPYEVSGVLMDKSTGKPLVIPGTDGEVTGKAVFTPDTPDGEVEVEFSFDASGLKGTSIVVFEELSVGGVVVADHKDIDDEGQTVKVPSIGTRALSGDGTKVVASYAGQRIVDTVKYEGLVPGKEYRMRGIVYDKQTGKPAVYLDGTGVETVVEAEALFTPVEADGFVELSFAVDASSLKGHDLVVFEELLLESTVVAEHKEVEDEGQTVKVPEIHTEALGAEGTHVAEDGSKAVITDRVDYKNLVPGVTYTMSGVLMDKGTGKPVLNKDDEEVTASVKFTPETPEGSVELAFKVDTRELAGHTLVAFEELTLEGKVVTDHKDFEDEGQTVYVPKLGTRAVSEGGGKVLTFGTEAKFTDIVSYQNLVPGIPYTLVGWVMDKETGEPVMAEGYGSPEKLPGEEDAGLKRLEVTKTFVPEGKDGEVSMEFILDTTKLAGKDVVMFEELYIKGTLVGDHKDIEDEGQTLRIPSMGTQALSGEGRKIVSWGMDATVVDKVRFTGLTPGEEYEVTGYLVDKRAGEAVLPGGEPVVSTARFTPDKADGYVEMVFTFDSRKLAGMDLVAFEEITLGGTLVADHKDKDDEGQTVQVSKLGTTAGTNWGDKVVRENGQAVVVDTVHYQNLVPDLTYRLEGVLMDKDSGQPIMQAQADGPEAPVTASAEFTPETRDGDVDLKFTLDATSLDGHTIVVFESLYVRSTLVGEHKDIEDEGQTVYVPEIGTLAHDGEGGKEIASNTEAKAVDTVSYKNLVPGITYTLSGKLMDQATGLVVAEGSTEFTPDTAEGTVDMEFIVDTTALGGHTLVAFEYLEIRGVPVADHEDITDEGQSVRVPEIHTEASAAAVKTVESGEQAAVTDTVSYSGLEPGKGYVMKGQLMDKADGSVLAEAEAQFTPEAPEGSVELTFTLDTRDLAGHTLVAFEELLLNGKVTAGHKDLEDEGQTVYVAKIGTRAYGEDGGKVISRGRKTIVYDEVSYENLVPGQEYLLKGTLVDKGIGEAVASAEHRFTCGKKDGSVTLTFTVDTRAMAGRKLVAFEELYGFSKEGEEVPAADHKDITDADQTVSIPEIGTTAASADGGKLVPAVQDTVIVDTVEYHGLVPDEEYVLEGMLMDKATGKAAISGGREVTASKKFIPEEEDGFVDVLFTFDGRELAGKDLVVFERLYLEGGKEFARHEDLTDGGQTVTVDTPKEPWIGTIAADVYGNKELMPEAQVMLADRVEYHNLEEGKEYRLEGKAMDKATGDVLSVNGHPVTAEAQFIAEGADGEATVEFVLDASGLMGKDLVVFERLYQEDGDDAGKKVAVHEDIEDENQSVKVQSPDGPWIGTKADNGEGSKNLAVGGEAIVRDTVSYRNLETGAEYRLEGTLMDKGTGEPVVNNGEPVTASVRFTPEGPDGETEVVFTFDSTGYEGADLVVFEQLYLEGGPKVTVHEDITDKEQTVYVDVPEVPGGPSIGTTASGADGGKTVAAGEAVEIVDLVEYHNLEAGKSYRLEGELMDKETGEGISVYGEAGFVPDAPDGSVEVRFVLDTRAYAGKDLVVFERLYDEGTGRRVAVHEDIEDGGQTVTVETPAVPEIPETPETGLHNLAKAFGVIAACLAALGLVTVGIFLWRRRK